MKKILFIIAGVSLLTAFSSACKKTCVCQKYVLGVSEGTVEYPLEKDHKCSEFESYNTSDVTGVTGVKCE